MTTTFRAVYEPTTRTLHPLEQVDLPDGELLVSARLAVEYPQREADDFPAQNTLAEALGFDPSDEKKLRELGESQYQAYADSMRRLEKLGLTGELARLPQSDSDLDAILYGAGCRRAQAAPIFYREGAQIAKKNR